jgi:predicted MFS family arabinose efflux permease
MIILSLERENFPVQSNHLTSNQHSRLNRIIVIVTLILFWSSLYLYVPIMSALAQKRGAGITTIGYLISTYGLAQLLLRIPLGIWSDQINRRRPFVTVGLFLSVIGALGMAWSKEPFFMVFFRGLTGVCASMYVMLTVLLSSAFPPDQKGKAMGIAFFITHVCQVVTGLVGGYIAEFSSWEGPFIAAAIIGGLGCGFSFLLPEMSTDRSSYPKLSELLQAAVRPRLLSASLLGALVQCLPFITIYGFTPVLARALGASETQLGWLTFASGIPMAVGSFLSTKTISSRLPSKLVVIGCFLLAGITLAFFPLAKQISDLIVLQMLVSFSSGLAVPTLMALSAEGVPLTQQGTTFGVFQAVYALGMFLGPIYGGYLGRIFGLEGVFLGTCLLMLIGVIATLLFLKPAGKKSMYHSA